MTPLDQLHAHARAIFAHALRACDIPAAFDRHLRFNGATLIRQGSPAPVQLDRFREILIVALGKAALPMTETLLNRIPPHISVRGICSAPHLPTHRDPRIRYYAGGHPLPNSDSLDAARETLRLLHSADAGTFIFYLISGGGSAMLELPLGTDISLEHTIAFHRALVASGAAIGEINTVRKHFSAVKGGRLALVAPRSEKLSLIVSDVPLKDLVCVASSPTLPDSSTPQQCWEILNRFHLLEAFPESVRKHFRDFASTPLNEMADSDQYEVLLSDEDLANAARDHARALGYHSVIDNTCDDWDYRKASAYLLQRFQQLRREFPRVSLLSSGEVTVKLEGPAGCGGRNQQFTLATAFELAKNPEDHAAILSAGSDGIDGNSPAAGAIADSTTLSRARAAGINPEAALTGFNSYSLFTALNNTIITGPTGNNLRDLRILLAFK